MAAFQTVTFDDVALRSALKAARARGQDMRPALRTIGQAGVNQTKKRFISKRGPDGSSWKPTRKIGGTTLIASGLLLRSISVRQLVDASVAWGSNRVYAAIHQFGGTIKPVNGKHLKFRVGGNGGWVSVKSVTIPARPYLGINTADLAEFAAIALRHVGQPLTGGAA